MSASAACSNSIIVTPRRRAVRVFAHHGVRNRSCRSVAQREQVLEISGRNVSPSTPLAVSRHRHRRSEFNIPEHSADQWQEPSEHHRGLAFSIGRRHSSSTFTRKMAWGARSLISSVDLQGGPSAGSCWRRASSGSGCSGRCSSAAELWRRMRARDRPGERRAQREGVRETVTDRSLPALDLHLRGRSLALRKLTAKKCCPRPLRRVYKRVDPPTMKVPDHGR